MDERLAERTHLIQIGEVLENAASTEGMNAVGKHCSVNKISSTKAAYQVTIEERQVDLFRWRHRADGPSRQKKHLDVDYMKEKLAVSREDHECVRMRFKLIHIYVKTTQISQLRLLLLSYSCNTLQNSMAI